MFSCTSTSLFSPGLTEDGIATDKTDLKPSQGTFSQNQHFLTAWRTHSVTCYF